MVQHSAMIDSIVLDSQIQAPLVNLKFPEKWAWVET